MLIDKILTFIYNCISGVIDFIPDMSFQLPEGVFGVLDSTFSVIGFLLPMPVIIPLITYIIGREVFRLGYAVWLTIKSYIPTISGG